MKKEIKNEYEDGKGKKSVILIPIPPIAAIISPKTYLNL